MKSKNLLIAIVAACAVLTSSALLILQNKTEKDALANDENSTTRVFTITGDSVSGGDGTVTLNGGSWTLSGISDSNNKIIFANNSYMDSADSTYGYLTVSFKGVTVALTLNCYPDTGAASDFDVAVGDSTITVPSGYRSLMRVSAANATSVDSISFTYSCVSIA
jgi:hypothetical protein